VTATQNSEVISSVAIRLSTDDIAKIRLADTVLLTNAQDTKIYSSFLYKPRQEKKTIDLNSGTISRISPKSFCWAATEKENGILLI
jgi:hypothetical protein